MQDAPDRSSASVYTGRFVTVGGSSCMRYLRVIMTHLLPQAVVAQ